MTERRWEPHGPQAPQGGVRAPEGPLLLALLALALLGLAASVVALQGLEELGLRSLLRATARSSLALFLAAFSASSLRRLWPSPATAWLLRNRRHLGLAFAVSHTIHLFAVIGLERGGWVHLDPATLLIGGSAYAVVYAMAATSSDAAVRALGARRWRRLHLVGSWWLWGIFAFFYGARAVAEGWLYVPLVAGLAAALLLRLAARSRRSPRALSA